MAMDGERLEQVANLTQPAVDHVITCHLQMTEMLYEVSGHLTK
jgi:hypothetical protein